jgi:PAS domain S-box-containing protein
MNFHPRLTSRKVDSAFYENLLHGIADSIGDFISVYDTDDSVLFVSSEIEKLTGWTPEEFYKKDFKDLIHPSDQLNFFRSIASSGGDKNKTGTCVEWRVRCKSGTYIWLETHIESIRIGSKGAMGRVFSSRDITDRKHFELELQMSGRRLKCLLWVSWSFARKRLFSQIAMP